MKVNLFKVFIFVVFSLIYCSSIFAQNKSLAGKALIVTAKTPIIIVGATAKIAYKTTKFTTKEVVWPVAKVTLKPLIVKAAPSVSLFLLKETGKVAEKSIPISSKLIIGYLKYRLAIP